MVAATTGSLMRPYIYGRCVQRVNTGRKQKAQIDWHKLILIWSNVSTISFFSAGLSGSEGSSNTREHFSFTKLGLACIQHNCFSGKNMLAHVDMQCAIAKRLRRIIMWARRAQQAFMGP